MLVIPPENVLNLNDYSYPGHVLLTAKTLNFIIPYIHEKKIIGLYRGDVLFGKFDIINPTTATDILFNDKLTDMKGYEYTALVNTMDSRLVQMDNKFLLPETLFLETIAEKQNAKYDSNFSHIRGYDNFEDAVRDGRTDMVLNLGTLSNFLDKQGTYKAVNTYETNGYCTLAPIQPDHETFLKFIVKPFNNYVWYLLTLAIILGALVWQGFFIISESGMVTGRYFIIDILLAFIQQPIRIRRVPFGLKIMLQIFIFMMIVIANVYQGMVTSILMDQKKFEKVESIEELMSEDYEFYSDALFLKTINESGSNQNIADKIKPLDDWLQNSAYIKQFQDVMTANPKNVLIALCDLVPELLETQIDAKTKGRDVYYELQQKMFVYYENILLIRRNLFHERLNEMSLRIHETGIKQHWLVMMGKYEKPHLKINNDATMLSMEQMKPIFKSYFYGLILASFVFLFDFFKNSLRMLYRRWIKKFLKCVHRYRHRKVGPRMRKF